MSGTELSVTRTTVSGNEAAVRELTAEYFREANALGSDWFDDEEYGLPPAEIVPADVERLGSAAIDQPLFLAHRDGTPAGMVQIKRLSDTEAEVKRLYVRPEHRGAGVGRALVETMVEATRTDGFETLRLGVAPYHDRATELYRSLGFEFTSQYEQSQTPPELVGDWNFMKRSLVE